MAEWSVNKNPVLEACAFTTQWHVLSANVTAVSLNFWLLKLVKEQSLIFCNRKFNACVILKER